MNDELFAFQGEPTKVTLKELDNALELLSDCTDEEEANDYWNIVNDYVLYRMWEKDVETFTVSDVSNQSQQLLVDYCLQNLVEADLVDVSIDENGESYFELKK